MSAAIPDSPVEIQPPTSLRRRLKAAWAALRGRSVMCNVRLSRNPLDATLHVAVGDGFQLYNNTFEFEQVYLNGVSIWEIDLSAQRVDP